MRGEEAGPIARGFPTTDGVYGLIRPSFAEARASRRRGHGRFEIDADRLFVYPRSCSRSAGTRVPLRRWVGLMSLREVFSVFFHGFHGILGGSFCEDGCDGSRLFIIERACGREFLGEL